MLEQFEKWNKTLPVYTGIRNATEEQFKACIEDEREAAWIAALKWAHWNIDCLDGMANDETPYACHAIMLIKQELGL